MRVRKMKAFAFVLILIYTFCTCLSLSAAAYEADDKKDEETVSALSEDIEISSRLYELFCGKNEKTEKRMLAVGGGVFGLKIKEDGISVTDARHGSSFRVGDRIIKVNGCEVYEVSDVEESVKSSGGKPISFEIIRERETLKMNVTPTLENGEYKLGIGLRCGASGIGTVTYIDPETKLFGGLGHGVCNAIGEVIPIEYGMTTNVVLGGIKRGECGKPGELSGVLGKVSTGTIISNTECGVFGKLDSYNPESMQLYEVGTRDELCEGKAEIIATVKNGRQEKYSIEIHDIDIESDGSKSFKIKVCDDALIALTGGIVRGMSGSPIIQNGKLVGAVTHVMVANPTEGYGIFIENMLSAAQNQTIPKAA